MNSYGINGNPEGRKKLVKTAKCLISISRHNGGLDYDLVAITHLYNKRGVTNNEGGGGEVYIYGREGETMSTQLDRKRP